MENKSIILDENDLKNKIYTIRGVQVMLDSDLAQIYGYETKRFNEQVKNNIERFDEDFRFQLTQDEVDVLRSKFSTTNISTMSRSLPYAFTEQGIYMLMTVLKGELAVKQSKTLIRLFKQMKDFVLTNSQLFAEIDSIKKHLIESDLHHKENDKRIDELFTLMDKYKIKEKQGIFFQGQIFDAYAKFESFIQSAKKEIVLIDGYVDLTVLERLAKKQKGVNVLLYTDSKTKITNLDVQKFNAQYPTLTLNFTSKMHDRFLIIDNSVLYHIGASLKDLAKKCFAFEILDSSLIPSVLGNLQGESMENKIKVFENKNIRTVWNEEEEDWYFSVVDIIEILTGTERPRKYWNDLKKKLTIEGSELSEKIGQLKMAAADGKMRETDVLSTKNVLRLVQ